MDARLTSVYWTLRLAFGLTAFLAGLDKFFNLLTDWERYLSPLMLQVVPLSGAAFMRIVGVIEVVAGLAILAGVTRLGSYVVSAWLALIAVNLVTTGQFFDIAVRDLVMSAAAFALARISEIRDAGTGVAQRSIPAQPIRAE